MYIALQHTHSLLRYFVLFMLLFVVVNALYRLATRKPYGNLDNKASLYLVIFAHLQLLVGLFLYYVSPNVQFNAQTMADKGIRYWTVEHLTIMLVAITLITAARIGVKKVQDERKKHLRTGVFNGIALLLIIMALAMSGRGILHPNWF
jgi:hypothetical protein